MNTNHTQFFFLLISMLLIQHIVLGNTEEISSRDGNDDLMEQLNPANQYCPGVFSFAGSTKAGPECNSVPTGYIHLSVSGGTPPYSFKWKRRSDTTQNLNDLFAGDYTVTVTDFTGCMADTSIHLNPGYHINFKNTDNICPDEAKGVIDIYDATSCMCSYSHCTTEFTKDGNAVGTIVNTSTGNAPGSTLQNLTSGVYHYKFTSTYGCVIYDSVEIAGPPSFALTIQYTEETASGAHDATAKATISGGTAPYTYQWNDPANQTTQMAIELTGNRSYTVTVTDSKNCQTSSSIVIATAISDTTSVDTSTSVTAIGAISQDLSSVQVYPNPGIQEVIVEVEKKSISSYSLVIHDATGQTVREYNGITEDKFKIKKDDLNPGLYQAIMMHPNGRKSFKIMFSE
jgi:hypothetical protein